jgi:lipoprotein-anchoring transpeptidase ErfK/SrfK
MNGRGLFRKNLYLLLFLWVMGLLSCRQVLPPPPALVKIQPPQEAQPVLTIPTEDQKAQEALTAPAVVDIPPPVPILPPMKEEIKLALPESVQIVVRKNERKLLLYQKGELVKMFPVDLGKNPKGPKVHQGDMRTPEGDYCIVEKRDLGQTKFYLAFVLNYPNESDRQRYEFAVKNGRLPKETGIGSLIEIHGEGIGFDWTQGCIALDNSYMQELFKKIPVGTPVRIEP